jgi:bifunctional oligoribonuclease and PAP phosphatase NrnA
MLAEVLNQIGSRSRFVVTSHARPDGDSIGSVLACSQILRRMGKYADVLLRDAVPAIYRILPFTDTVMQVGCVPADYDAAIILECDSLQRTRLEGLERHYLINIDHHASAREYADVNWIDSSACATAEMIYRIAKEAHVEISPEIATCLYTAVLTDTGSFCYTGTSERTFALAQELVKAGANPVGIAQNVYFSNPTSKMRLLGCALSHLRKEGKLAWMYVTAEDMQQSDAAEEDCEGLVNYALGIGGVEVAMFIRELSDGRFRVSLRSKGAVNVAGIAQAFGGGGHECASGCALEGTLSSASQRVLEQFRLLGFGVAHQGHVA